MTTWGWKRTDPGATCGLSGGIHWVPGTLEASYARVSGDGNSWILVSAAPVSEFRRAMKEAAA